MNMFALVLAMSCVFGNVNYFSTLSPCSLSMVALELTSKPILLRTFVLGSLSSSLSASLSQSLTILRVSVGSLPSAVKSRAQCVRFRPARTILIPNAISSRVFSPQYFYTETRPYFQFNLIRTKQPICPFVTLFPFSATSSFPFILIVFTLFRIAVPDVQK